MSYHLSEPRSQEKCTLICVSRGSDDICALVYPSLYCVLSGYSGRTLQYDR